MAEYANTHFETYVKEADLKQQILMENPVPDNLEQVKKLDDFVRDILKDKRKQKDLDIDGTIEKLQSESRYPLIWLILEHILRTQCSCWARPVITSHILEGITFWQPSTVQRNSPNFHSTTVQGLQNISRKIYRACSVRFDSCYHSPPFLP